MRQLLLGAILMCTAATVVEAQASADTTRRTPVTTRPITRAQPTASVPRPAPKQGPTVVPQSVLPDSVAGGDSTRATGQAGSVTPVKGPTVTPTTVRTVPPPPAAKRDTLSSD